MSETVAIIITAVCFLALAAMPVAFILGQWYEDRNEPPDRGVWS